MHHLKSWEEPGDEARTDILSTSEYPIVWLESRYIPIIGSPYKSIDFHVLIFAKSVVKMPHNCDIFDVCGEYVRELEHIPSTLALQFAH